tara:strand:+ start:313 stop:1284 length:972 start_codon:yes stop_codon:yes gene_type:complete
MIEEEVKKQRSKNFYLTVYNQIKEGVRPSEICKRFNISKQKLNYYLSTLKRSECIKKIGYGLWEISGEFNEKKVKETTRITKYQPVKIKPDFVRGHAFQFKLKIPKLRNWEKREEILKKKDIEFKQLKHLLGGGQEIKIKDKKIWLTNKSIIIFEKSSYLAKTAKESRRYAIYDLFELVRSLESTLGANFKINKRYCFKVSRQHYALVKNALAEQYNGDGKKLEVYSEDGLWFVIDNSYNLNEAETVHPKTAVDDSTKVQNFFNGLKVTEDYTPQIMIKAVTQNAENLNNYAVHLKSHVKSVKQLGGGVKELNKLIKKLDKRL